MLEANGRDERRRPHRMPRSFNERSQRTTRFVNTYLKASLSVRGRLAIQPPPTLYTTFSSPKPTIGSLRDVSSRRTSATSRPLCAGGGMCAGAAPGTVPLRRTKVAIGSMGAQPCTTNPEPCHDAVGCGYSIDIWRPLCCPRVRLAPRRRAPGVVGVTVSCLDLAANFFRGFRAASRFTAGSSVARPSPAVYPLTAPSARPLTR